MSVSWIDGFHKPEYCTEAGEALKNARTGVLGPLGDLKTSYFCVRAGVPTGCGNPF